MESLDDLAAFLDTKAAEKSGVLIEAGGDSAILPSEICDALRTVVQALAQGMAVTITPHHQRVTTQKAAEILGVSRPTLVRMLNDGLIPFEQPGKHRRLLLRDVLEHKERTTASGAFDDGGLA